MVHALADAGEDVVVLDNLSTGFRFLMPARVPLIVGSTGDRELAARVIREHKVDSIIHFAASIVVPDSVRDPLGYYRNNTLNTCNLLDVAVANGVKRFIFSSTAAVYGNPERVPAREDDPKLPISPYGASKLMSEAMLRDTGFAHGLRYVVLRYFNVAGADPQGRTGQATPQATHLIKVACEAALGKRAKVDVFGTDYPTPDGTGVRDYIHVSDLAAAHSAALAYLRGGGESATFNCGYGRGASVMEVIASVKRVSGVDFPVALGPRREGDPAELIADVSRIRSALPWTPRFQDLDTIVSHAFTWERSLDARRTGTQA
jgi:UDP-glucose 4-epimerase